MLDAKSQHFQWQSVLPVKTIKKAPHYGLAAWVSEIGDPIAIQATGGWIGCKCFPSENA